MSSIKRMIGGFYKRVHPDLLYGYPLEAVDCNLRSLKELNSYIDRVESPDVVPGPFVTRSLQFFQPLYSRHGKAVGHALRPTQISLPSIPPSADMLTKEELSISLIRDIEKSMEVERVFSDRPIESKLIDSTIRSSDGLKGEALVRANLVNIWRKEKMEADAHEAVWYADDQADEKFRNYKAIMAYNKAMKKCVKLKNPKTKIKRIEEAHELAENVYNEKHSKVENIQLAVARRVIESGFHPDLVFFIPELSDEERRIGLDRVVGANLQLDEEIWLLENIWKEVRKDMAVPLVLGRSFAAHLNGGYIEIPFDFGLSLLVDFLEDNLETVRAARTELIQNFVSI